MSLRLSAPWLLLAAAPLLALVLYRLRRLPREHAGPRRRVVQALMLLGVALAGAALAGLEWGTRLDRLAVIFVLDRSRSVERASDPGAARALEAIADVTREMRSDDVAGLVVFGAEAATEALPGPSPTLGPLRAVIARDATDIGAGLRRALADLPADYAARLVLVSDGVETRGDALAAAQAAAGRGVPIDVLPLERAPSAELAIRALRVPERADPGEPLELRIVTRATAEAEVDLTVQRDGVPIATTRTRLRPGEDLLTLRDVAEAPGVHRYDVIVEPVRAEDDAARENNQAAGYVRVSGGARALVLAGEPEQAEALAGALRRAGLEVSLRSRTDAPVDLGGFAGFDLVVLSDLEARALTPEALTALRSYVRDLGGGLLMLGVRDAFGLGGYAYTPVEDALPATFDLRKRRDRASLGMVIAIDNSGSMGAEVSPGTNKLDLANEGAARSILLLSPTDRAGVMHVDTSVTWTVPMAAVESPERMAAVVRRAEVGGGGILVDLTLEAAYARLRGERTQLKHLLLFSDGSDSEEMNQARSLVGAAARDRITTSIVSMGNGSDTPELERLARIGGGRFYIVEDMRELPRIFTRETIEASRSAIAEKPFRATVAGESAVVRGIDFEASPLLAGYVLMNQRPSAQRLLAAADDDPLLLVWQYGVGRSATFATDAGAQLARSWLAWPGYTALFGQLGRDLARAPERRDADVRVSVEGGVGRVVVEAVDDRGGYRNYLDLRAVVAAPGGEAQPLMLAQTGAGRYEATFDAEAPGAYLVTVREEGRGLVGSASAVRPAGEELRGEGTDGAKLAQIAAQSGGRVLTELRGTFARRPPPVYAHAPLWRPLVLAALLSLLASVALRRLVLPPRWYARLLPAPVRRWLERPAAGARETGATGAAAEATLAALAAARARTQSEGEGAGERAPAQARVAPRAPDAARPRRAADGGAGRSVRGDAEPARAPPGGDGAAGGAPGTGAAEGGEGAPPASLAEQILARRKRK